MMLLAVLKVAAAGITATLAACSASNMYQTHSLLSQQEREQQECPIRMDIDAINNDDHGDNILLLKKLQQMKRRELLQLYLSSSTNTNDDSLSAMDGHWNGILLDNHYKIMTAVSILISNQLFGRGRPWNGKAFYPSNNRGANRFATVNDSDSDDGDDCAGNVETRHDFDYSIAPSSLDGKSSICLVYWKHNHPISLWSTMKDEIRLLTPTVAIGMGYMGWSGGKLNSSPFVLYKGHRNHQLQQH